MMKAALVTLASIAAASAAIAAPPQNPLAKDQVKLDLRNLDLATVNGQRLLAIRMDQAARDVCGDRLATVHLALEAQSRACRADVLADIRSRIESRVAQVGRTSATPVQVALQ